MPQVVLKVYPGFFGMALACCGAGGNADGPAIRVPEAVTVK
jgi:hypothetical protein